MKAEEFLKQRDIPNEVITVQRDGFIEGNRVSFLMEEYAQLPKEGAEVYVECDEMKATHRAHIRPVDTDDWQYGWLKKLTHPTVSAGEEWNKEAIELVKKYIPNNALAKDYILELLTRPTVSEEERTEQYPIVCPSCFGSGYVSCIEFNPNVTGSAMIMVCPACNGSKTVIVKRNY